MTDRELLELAAKAAGIEGEYECWTGQGFKEGIRQILNGKKCLSPWNPRLDDGDALRLACDLGLRVFPVARTSSGAACSAVGSVTSERLSEVADAALDTRAATRRAIVRAAAEIGKAMP